MRIGESVLCADTGEACQYDRTQSFFFTFFLFQEAVVLLLCWVKYKHTVAERQRSERSGKMQAGLQPNEAGGAGYELRLGMDRDEAE